MTKTILGIQTVLLTAAVGAALLTVPQVSRAAVHHRAQAAEALPEVAATTNAEARLNKKQFQNVKVTVDNGIATLTGAVDLYEYKADAGKRVLHAKGVTAVRNLIEVSGATVPDRELQAKLEEKLAYDRVGYGNVFNAVTVSVTSGVVTLGGHARTDVDKDSALALVATTAGVKDVVGEIDVDPVSSMDDRIRLDVARAVYGYASLNRYAIDPARPIRISVQNGNVELYGMVASQSDKDTAFMRANGVSGVFSVKNYLQVENQPSEAR